MPASKKYDQETQDRAVRMYADRIAGLVDSDIGAACRE